MSGSTSTNQTPLWVETDTEPDDLLALRIFHRDGLSIEVVVVGESNPLLKISQILFYSDGTHKPGCVIRGIGSGRSHPRDPNVKTTECDRNTYFPTSQYVKKLREYVERTENPTMVIIKPPRELYENFSLVQDLLPKVNLYLYGSFNLRTLKAPGMNHVVLQAFKNVYLHESYLAFGDDSSINRLSTPKLYDLWTSSSCSNVKAIDAWMKVWNHDMLRVLSKDDARSEESVRVNEIIRAKIKPFLDFQFVAADMILALYVGKGGFPGKEKVGVTWDEHGYTTKDSSSTTRVYLLENVKLKDLDDDLCHALF